MCGRYYIDDEDAAIQELILALSREDRNGPGFAAMKTGEIFPSDIAPVIAKGCKPKLMKWGFQRFDGKGRIINALIETAMEKPMFRAAMSARRCLVPATNYFEWEKLGASKRKHAITVKGSPVIYMAGLFRYEAGSDMPAYVILTHSAHPNIAYIHDRMPVILSEDTRLGWLNGDIEYDCGLEKGELIATALN